MQVYKVYKVYKYNQALYTLYALSTFIYLSTLRYSTLILIPSEWLANSGAYIH
jgi:hypothetical protein